MQAAGGSEPLICVARTSAQPSKLKTSLFSMLEIPHFLPLFKRMRKGCNIRIKKNFGAFEAVAIHEIKYPVNLHVCIFPIDHKHNLLEGS